MGEAIRTAGRRAAELVEGCSSARKRLVSFLDEAASEWSDRAGARVRQQQIEPLLESSTAAISIGRQHVEALFELAKELDRGNHAWTAANALAEVFHETQRDLDKRLATGANHDREARNMATSAQNLRDHAAELLSRLR